MIDPRTGLDEERLSVLRAVDRACTWGKHRPKTAPTTRAVAQLASEGPIEGIDAPCRNGKRDRSPVGVSLTTL